MPRIPRRRDEPDEAAGGEPQSELSSRGPADDDAAPHDSEAPQGAAVAGGDEGARDAEQEEEARSQVSVTDEPEGREGEDEGQRERRERREAREQREVDRHDDDEYRWHTGRQRPTGAPDAVEFVDVHKAFGRNRILRGLNMGLPEGKISMILGPSGTGKSVCIKHMVGLLYPDDGDVLVHGESVPNMQDDELFEMRKKFGVLFQDGALFGSMNVFDNTAFPLRQHTDKGEDEIGEIVNRRLKEVGLGDAGDKMPNELSGGMRKRAGFARSLVLDPDIVLFDEPDSGLDPVRTALLAELIQEIHEEMMAEREGSDRRAPAFTLITHDIMTARRAAEHISVLWKGRIVESGPAEELFHSDNAFVRQFLSGDAQGPLGME
jgi:phospholipid/cholesterol/gamma-HCH transport system ATP-binding protein